MQNFHCDEEGYIEWCKNNKGGYVFNYYQKSNPESNKLHKVNCIHLWYPDDEGKRTTLKRKMCSIDIEELVDFATKLCGNNWSPCKTCRPLGTLNKL